MTTAVATESTTTTETVPTGDQAANQAAADAAAAAAAIPTPPVVVPPVEPVTPVVDVQYTLALPKDAVIEASAVERATAFAKAEKLSPEAAQKALDFVNTEVAADRAKQETANQDAFKTLARETWVADLKADTTFGGEKYLTTREEIKRAADRFLTPAERETLNVTGWGNHPMLCRMFARIGQALANDKLVMGGGAGSAGSGKSDAQALYPGMNP